MIIYFSATGNSRFVADKISNVFNEKIYSILEIKEIVLKDGESLGIVVPTYFWGLPSIVNDFLKYINIKYGKNNYIYAIATYGTSTGQICKFINKYVKLDAYFSIKMADTWTPTFDLTNTKKLDELSKNEIPQISKIIKHIKNKDTGDYFKDKKPVLLSYIAQIIYQKQRKTSHLHVNDNCIGCKLCEKNCPIEAIEIKNKKPIWVKNKCVMCLSCLHHCPKFAIHYDNRTQKHGQYLHI